MPRGVFKVKQLKDILGKFDDNDLVIVADSSDSDYFMPLATVKPCFYTPHPDHKDIAGICTKEELNNTSRPAICLWPKKI